MQKDMTAARVYLSSVADALFLKIREGFARLLAGWIDAQRPRIGLNGLLRAAQLPVVQEQQNGGQGHEYRRRPGRWT